MIKVPRPDEEAFNRIFAEIEENMHVKLSARQKDRMRKTTRIGVEATQRIVNVFADNPISWVNVAMSVLYMATELFLGTVTDLPHAKTHVKTAIMQQVARTMNLIAVYPDTEKTADFHWKSHNELERFFDDEAKKWET